MAGTATDGLMFQADEKETLKNRGKRSDADEGRR